MSTEQDVPRMSTADVPVIDLSKAPSGGSWGRSALVVALWTLVELMFVTNPLQVSSGLRIRVLRLFGAKIGKGVIFRPRTRVRFPWRLHIGDRSWIGDGVWFSNRDHIYIGHDAVISQQTFLTTGSHALRRDMAVITRPIHIEPGAWVTARCIVLGGAHIGRSAVITPGTVVSGPVPANTIWNGAAVGARFS